MEQLYLVSGISAVVGLVVGLFISTNSGNSDYYYFFIYSAISAFVTSAFLWYIFVYRYPSAGVVRGAIVNGISGALAHYVCWYLIIATISIQYYITGKPLSSLGEPPMGLLYGIWGAFIFSFFSLLAFGWITVPAGALIGFLVRKFVN